jgi:hypothetical protein
MQFLTFDGITKLIDRIDFLDFVSGGFRSRIRSSTLTADRTLTTPDKDGAIAIDTARSTGLQNLTTPGLVQLPAGANSVPTVLPVGAAGMDLIGSANTAAARGAIDAQRAAFPGATTVDVLSATSGLQRRASDNSVWFNDNLVEAPATIAERALSQRGLVPNGSGVIPAVADRLGVLRAEGWSKFKIDQQNKLAGLYSLRRDSTSYGDENDSFFAVAPGVVYGWYSVAFAGDNPPSGANYALALSMWDGEPVPNPVNLFNYQYISGSAGLLSRPLAVGDRRLFISKASLPSAAPWEQGYYRAIGLFGSSGYVSPTGTQYYAPQSGSPLGFYTRWISYLRQIAAPTVTDLGSEWEIQIAADMPNIDIPNPAGGSWPIGTKVGLMQGGDGNFFYPGPTSYRNFIPGGIDAARPISPPESGDYTQYRFAVFGTVPSTVAKSLAPGTAQLKIVVYLLNAADMRFNVNIFEVV